ncbi:MULTISPECIES: FlgO family outer membrane protein [unclassified Undibacterium]|uniref:FlgO family outer membrane protein n=1 Tax=unclassified Undibacterium TaxID=2630295 RepID=UPI002AC960FA|nr:MULTISPECIES: FlgO family outer membrane protein [unclassified Undibacterium]MEB0137774.1 FlgO family outer membrane protein [Undibacterium sp. CCC2.1]MEB0171035.1 FlgO family outer membrane protein [Undibacterium sp. CCC1.1]MEB0175080.1 FlgO family outer membrane protein [Undibacterium sp. CCC3.4]MEB0215142.1 FlgO family outer membrane protein [Undibacterium sp. 5I2]WPX44884.1 FlgO family outer membrane protein [Undibacterium sp. CCC3.4]
MKKILPLLACTLIFSGCSSLGSFSSGSTVTTSATALSWKEAETNEFIPTNQRAALALIRAAGSEIDKTRPLIVATLVNINALEESSTFGRIVAEQVSGQFSHAGYQMVEMKFRDKVFMKQNVGELLLTREIREVAQDHSAQAVIVGTYAESEKLVFVNLKLIRPGDNIVLSTYDYAVPMDRTVKSLLGRR